MHKYKILIAYDGTHYSGWQIQPNALSIQECIEKALSTFLKLPTRVLGAGRTDAGVHAKGQTAHFVTDHVLDERRALYALNSLLPHDIRIKEIQSVTLDFHAQYSATGKIYHYHVWTEKTIDPFYRLYRHQFTYPLTFSILEEAAQQFVGKKNFASFTNLGSSVKSTVRTITRLDLVEEEGGFRFEFEGDGFLYKMVRNIVGTLLEIGTRKRIEDISFLLEERDRRKAGMAAPAKGLFLMKVHYNDIFL